LWHSPIVSKREGYNVLSLDVFDEATLRERATQDPLVPRDHIPNIQPVDLMGTAMEIERLAADRGVLGQVDYIVSSHNFEHLPDPVRFLQGCAAVLRPGGHLTMAIPDRRACFDYFRSHSMTGDFLAAYFEARTRPTPAQNFIHAAQSAHWQHNGENLDAFSINHDPKFIKLRSRLVEAFRAWEAAAAEPDETYRDAHCWTFTPASFEVIVKDLHHLDLVALELDEVLGPNGCEFYVRLVKSADGANRLSEAEFLSRRAELLHRANVEAAANARLSYPGALVAGLRRPLARRAARVMAIRQSLSSRMTASLRRVADVLRGMR
jgi:SAM-dependent methyltransferase